MLQVITPWDVSGGSDGKIDYDKLIREVTDTYFAVLSAHIAPIL